MTTNCSSCRFYRGTSIGMCHRYPNAIKVASGSWCGEYSAFEKPQITSEKKKPRDFPRPSTDKYSDKV